MRGTSEIYTEWCHMKRLFFACGNGFGLLRGMFPALLASILTMSAGCATMNYPPQSDRPSGPFYYEADYDEVWDAAVDSITELEFRIIVMNKAEGFIATDMKDTSPYSRSGIDVRVRSLDGFIRVELIESFEIYAVSRMEPNRYRWSGPSIAEGGGFYENLIGEMIAKKLSKPYMPGLSEQAPTK